MSRMLVAVRLLIPPDEYASLDPAGLPLATRSLNYPGRCPKNRWDNAEIALDTWHLVTSLPLSLKLNLKKNELLLLSSRLLAVELSFT